MITEQYVKGRRFSVEDGNVTIGPIEIPPGVELEDRLPTFADEVVENPE